MRAIITAIVSTILLGSLFFISAIAAGSSNSTVTLKGKVFVTDKKVPIADAEIWFRPADGSSGGAKAKTDENGDYKFDNLPTGKYKVSIRSFYKRQEDVPCKLLMGKTKDVGATLMVMQEKGQFVQMVMIDSFSVKGNKEIVKDFDVTCKPAFGQ